MGSNSEKSTIAIAILVKLPFLKGTNFFFSHFGSTNNIFAGFIPSRIMLNLLTVGEINDVGRVITVKKAIEKRSQMNPFTKPKKKF